MIGPATSSGLISADGVVSAAPGILHSISLVAAGAAATLIVYDHASAASGTVLCTLAAAAGTTEHFHSPFGVVVNNGLYADIGGAGATAVVHYNKG